MPASFDVIVIGLGGMGSATAYHLAGRGARVLGLERHTPAHDRGSSHGRSRVIRQAYFEDPAYVPLLLRAYELWEQLERETGEHLLTITGGLMIGPPDSVTVAGSLRSARAHGLAYELLDADEIHRRFPPITPPPGIVAFYERRAGLVGPEAAVAAHLRRAAALGADLRFEEPVLAWQSAPTGDRVQVTTAHGAYEAGQVVIAPGAWAPGLLADLRLPLVVERQVLYWFEPIGGVAPYAADRFPIYIWQLDDGITFYGFPAQAGPPGGVKVAVYRFGPRPEPAGVPAATHAPDGAPWTPETLDRTVHAAEIERMRQCLNSRLPTLNGRFLEAVTCMYTTTPDEHFVIGRHPAHPNVVIASPCSGHGFKFASVIGEILAELVTAGETRQPISLFDLARFTH